MSESLLTLDMRIIAATIIWAIEAKKRAGMINGTVYVI